MRFAGSLVLACCAAVLPGGCIPSNVVARADRSVRTDVGEVQFEPATDLRLDGYYTSVLVTGDAALTLRKVCYWFAADGSYTAAALVDESDGLAFQTLSGTWQMTSAGLSLDGAEPVATERAGDLVRLTTPAGVLVLQREALQ